MNRLDFAEGELAEIDRAARDGGINLCAGSTDIRLLPGPPEPLHT
ncbi:hypothetical protein [Sphingomonas sp.]